MWRIINYIEEAAKCESIGARPLVIIAGNFNGADLSPLCRSFKLYPVNQAPTHIDGACLDVILTNAPRCYTSARLLILLTESRDS